MAMIPAQGILVVEATSELIELETLDGTKVLARYNPETGVYTIQPPRPITFISISFHLDTHALDPDGGESDDGVVDATTEEGAVPAVRDILEPDHPSE